MDVKQQLIEEFEQTKGQFVIDMDRVKRLVGVVDGKEDYYWAYFDGRNISLASCVGGFTILKNKIDDKDYNEFVRLAKLNHYDLILKKYDLQEYEKAIEKETKLEGEDEWIAGPCFELN